MSRLKCVARWRRSSVLLGGMFSSKAMVSTLNRGSRTWRARHRFRSGDFLAENQRLKTEQSYHQASMHAAASQVGSVFSQVHRAQPLHHPVVGPLGNLCWRNIVLIAQRRERGLKLSCSSECENEYFKHTKSLLSPPTSFSGESTSSDGRRRKQLGS